MAFVLDPKTRPLSSQKTFPNKKAWFCKLIFNLFVESDGGCKR